MVAVDESLEPVRRRQVELSRMRILDAAANLERIILADPLEMVIIIGSQFTHIDIRRVDAALFLPDGRIIATAPSRRDPQKPRKRPSHNRACLIDPDSGTIINEQELKVSNASVGIYLNTTDGSVILDAGEGQDGSHLFSAQIEGDTFKIRKFGRDGVFGSFSPTGDRLLLLPHPMSDEPVTLKTWPDLKRVAALDIDDVEMDEDDGFDVDGFHLHDDQIILRTFENRLLACSGSLEPKAWIDADLPLDPDGNPAVTGIIGLTRDTIAMETFTGDGPLVSMWRIPSL